MAKTKREVEVVVYQTFIWEYGCHAKKIGGVSQKCFSESCQFSMVMLSTVGFFLKGIFQILT